MSLYLEKLCCKIVKEYFGEIVADTAEVLMKRGRNSLTYITSATNLPRNKVREAIGVLIKHNLVIWDELRPNVPGYTLLNDRILLFLKYPRYVSFVRDKYGEDAEVVVDILWKEGQATASQIIFLSSVKLLDAAEEGPQNVKANIEDIHITVRNAFQKLVTNQYIQRCPDPQDIDQAVPTLSVKEELLYRFSPDSLDLKLLQKEISSKQLNPDQAMISQRAPAFHIFPDKDIFWRLNYDRFHVELRDIILQNAITHRIDSKAGTCFRNILQVSYRRNDPWVPTFQPILASELSDQQTEVPHLDQYMKVLAENGGGCLRKVGDAGGGEFVASISSLVRSLTLAHVDNLVQERFGSKAARIFRLVRDTGMMEQDHIADLSMIGKKEANVLTHRLLNDNFLRLYEVRKGISPSPASKSIYLFYVDLNMLVRMLLEWTFKALYNLMVQREMKHLQNKRLLEKKTRVEMIVESLKQSGATEEQIQDVEEAFSQQERETVKNVIETEDKLLDLETNLDETIFLLQMFLTYEMGDK